jgi:hypothetical protein
MMQDEFDHASRSDPLRISTRRVFITTLERLGRAVFWTIKALFFVLVAAIIIFLPSAAIRWSGRELPQWLHAVVLVVSAGLLVWGIYLISTENLRKRWFPWIYRMFGRLAGPAIFAGVLLLTTAEVFASFTFMLFDANAVELTANIPGRPIGEESLVDFYLWHFLNMIPALSIPELLNLRQPITYPGSWVGLLVLLFDAMIVLILIPTFQSWLQYRRELAADWDRAMSSAGRQVLPVEDRAKLVAGRRWGEDLPEEMRRLAQESPEVVVALTYKVIEGIVRSGLEATGYSDEAKGLRVVATAARDRGLIDAETLKAIDEMGSLWDLTRRLPYGSLSAKQALQFASVAQALAGTLGVQEEQFVSMVQDVLPGG